MSHRDEPANGDMATLFREDAEIELALVALSAAESLTDDLAVYLLEAAAVEEPRALVRGLRLCDFVAERNSEWHFVPRARNHLLPMLLEHTTLAQDMHGRLRDLSRSPESRSEFSALPAYLTEASGRAYHAAALSPQDGLPIYIELGLSSAAPRGQQWLGTRLAREQQELGILPSSSIGVDFLQGMVLYREGKTAQAEPLLRSVAGAEGDRIEIAVALHIVGRLEARQRRSPAAEAKLRRSLDILRRLADAFGEAQVLHTLGQLIGRDRQRTNEAETLLRQSLDIGEQSGNQRHQAQVLYSLGRLRVSNAPDEALDLLRRSLELNREIGDTFHAQRIEDEIRSLRRTT